MSSNVKSISNYGPYYFNWTQFYCYFYGCFLLYFTSQQNFKILYIMWKSITFWDVFIKKNFWGFDNFLEGNRWWPMTDFFRCCKHGRSPVIFSNFYTFFWIVYSYTVTYISLHVTFFLVFCLLNGHYLIGQIKVHDYIKV